jgi:hypothetical protein
MALFMAL